MARTKPLSMVQAEVAKLHARRVAYAKAGVCVACGQPTSRGARHCPDHLAYYRRRTNAIRADRRARGLCGQCGERPIERWGLCSQCQAAAAVRVAKRRAQTGGRAKTYSRNAVEAQVLAARQDDETAPLSAAEESGRPRVRSECADGPRPCPWWSCRYHLGCSVDEHGRLTITWPELEPDQIPHSCALDEAARGGMLLEDVADRLNASRQRAQQVEILACASTYRALRRGAR